VIRNFIIALLIVLVIIVGYVVWKQHTGGNTFGDGAISEHESTSSSDQAAMNAGVTTDVDGNTLAHPNPSRSDDPGTINTVPVGSSGSQSYSGSQNTTSTAPTITMGTPMTSSTPAPAPSPISAPDGLVSHSGHPVLGPGGPIPQGDSLSRSAPNGVGFAGTGKYMWYREGDITWRVNSDTGASCIAFATMQQWANPLVYDRGCDSRRG
jgi:hypothetical protein